MAKLVYLQFHNNVAFQDTVIEYEVGKEIVLINQDALLPSFKTECTKVVILIFGIS